jgi:hypothetical protein
MSINKVPGGRILITQKTSICHLVKVNGWATVVGDVGMHVEVPHAHLSEVPGVVLVEVNPVKVVTLRHKE